MRRWTSLAAVCLASLWAGCSAGQQSGTFFCTPGEVIEAGCGCNGYGSCSGDPVLIACDGTFSPAQCLDRESSGSLARNDDTSGCGLCSYVAVTCPPSGSVTLVSRAFRDGSSYRCSIERSPATRPPPGDPEPERDERPTGPVFPDASVDAL